MMDFYISKYDAEQLFQEPEKKLDLDAKQRVLNRWNSIIRGYMVSIVVYIIFLFLFSYITIFFYLKKEMIPMACSGISGVAVFYVLIRLISAIKQEYNNYHLVKKEVDWSARLVYIGNGKGTKVYGAYVVDGELYNGKIKVLFDDRSPGNFKYLVRMGQDGDCLVTRRILDIGHTDE